MNHVEFTQRVALAMLANHGDDWQPEAQAKMLVARPLPDYHADPLGWLDWKQEAEGRRSQRSAEAFARGFKAESDRFEV